MTNFKRVLDQNDSKIAKKHALTQPAVMTT